MHIYIYIYIILFILYLIIKCDWTGNIEGYHLIRLDKTALTKKKKLSFDRIRFADPVRRGFLAVIREKSMW